MPRLLSLLPILLVCLTGLAAGQTVQPRTDMALRATYAPIVERAAPAVVNIYATRVTSQRTRSVFDDPFFREFFGTVPGPSRQRVQSSLGSGVIVDLSGIVVTNNHVIEDAGEIKVVLADRREYAAGVILTDPQTDIAVLRLETDDRVPAIGFSDSEAAQVGDIVLAIGNPFGVGQTVTTGIVSALARTAASVSDYQFFIQTDAAINPGNSGGALVDVDGNLLGVNTAIYSRSGGSNGIGFAIPGNLVQQVIASATSGERIVRRPWLGVRGASVSAGIASAVGLDRPIGALVERLYPGGPADRAGLREGDVILEIGGQPIYDAEAVRYRPGSRSAGEEVEVDYIRDGRRGTAKVRLDYPPDRPARDAILLEGAHPLSGATVANLGPALAEELGLDPLAEGVVVTNVDRGSYAQRYRLSPGIRLLSVNGTDVTDTRSADRLLRGAGSAFLLRLADAEGRVSTLRIGR